MSKSIYENKINNELFSSLLEQINKSYRQLRLDTLKDTSQDVITWFKKFEEQTPRWIEEERGETVISWFEDYARNNIDK